jgi:C1A family cysteine protease
MKFACTLTMAAACAQASIYTSHNMTSDEKFASFKSRFNKVYKDAHEEAARAEIFAGNLARVDALNAREDRPPFGVTHFMDLTTAEFKKTMLNGMTGTPEKPPAKTTAPPSTDRCTHATAFNSTRFGFQQQLPVESEVSGIDVFSYCPGSDCSPMQNQGACGDCWAFAAAEVLETQISVDGGGLTRLSPQEYADCLTQSCETGGYPEMGWKLAQAKGTETLSNYPISSTGSGNLGSCREQSVSTGQVSSYGDAGSGDAQTMLNNLDSHGPLAVGVDAENWQFYDGGRYMGDPGCAPLTSNSCGTSIDHAVEIVGTYNSTAAYVDGWVIRNHWSTGWGCQLSGEGGYALLVINDDVCGVEDDAQMVSS